MGARTVDKDEDITGCDFFAHGRLYNAAESIEALAHVRITFKKIIPALSREMQHIIFLTGSDNPVIQGCENQ